MYVYDLLFLLYKCLDDEDDEGFQCNFGCFIVTLGVTAVTATVLLVVGSVLSTQNG